jgi:hypothetical protein
MSGPHGLRRFADAVGGHGAEIPLDFERRRLSIVAERGGERAQ